MPTLNTETQHSEHLLARMIPWNAWRSSPFLCNATDTELQRIQGTLEEASIPLRLGAHPLRSLLCLLYGHANAEAKDLLPAARRMGCDDSVICMAAATVGRTDLLDALIQPMEPEQRVTLIAAADYYAFGLAAENGHQNLLEYLYEQMSGPQRQAALQAADYYAFGLAAENGHQNLLEYLYEQMSGPQRQAALQATDYHAFRWAAQNGHQNPLEYLYEQMSEAQQQAALQADNYHAFRRAAQNGHQNTLEYLYEQMSEAQRQAALQADNYYAFRWAAQNAHQNLLEYLYEQMSEAQQQAALQADNYHAFRWAAQNGHQNLLEYLYEQMSEAQQQAALQAYHYHAFRVAAVYGHQNTLEYLYEQISGPQRQAALQADNYDAFRWAARNAHQNTLEYLYEQMSGPQRQAALQADNYDAFRWAAQNGHQNLLEYLYEQMSEAQQQAALQANDYHAFRRTAQNGHQNTLEYLYEQMSEAQQQAALQADNYHAFREAAEYGHQNTLEYLCEQMSEAQQRAALQAVNYFALPEAARNGHLNTLTYLYEQMSEAQQQAALQADNYHAFREAAEYGHQNTLEYLYEQMSEAQQQAALQAMNYDAFRRAARNGHQNTLKYLLRNHLVFAFAEMHAREYGSHVRPFAAARLEEWHEASASFMHNNPNGVFTLNAADSRLAFYVARHLVRENTEAASGQLRFLLGIPGVATLAHQAVTPGRENELLRLALTLENRSAAEILLTLGPVRALAEANNFYAREARGGFDLRAIAGDRESSVRALAPGERRRLERVNTHYGPTVQMFGVDNLLEVLRERLRERYSANPATITLNGITVILPPAWQEFLNLGLEGEARTRALEAYARNADHTALRWMLDPNPWMAANAAFVEGNPATHTGYSTYGNYRGLIALLWCAASDEDTPATVGHTLEGRMDHFVRELALIGRAHNWDRQRPALRADGTEAFEEYDDLEGDKPSCYSGVTRRLFQSVIGHPLIQPFGNDVLEAELRDFARDYFKSRITTDNHALLLGAQEAIENLEVLSDDQLQAMKDLNIPEEAITAFIACLQAKYAQEWTPSCTDFLRARLVLPHDAATHVNSLWLLTDFSGLLKTTAPAKHSPPSVAGLGIFAAGSGAASSSGSHEEYEPGRVSSHFTG